MHRGSSARPGGDAKFLRSNYRDGSTSQWLTGGIFHIEPDASADMQRYTLAYAGQRGIVVDNPDSIPAQSLDPNYPNTYSGVMHRTLDLIHHYAPIALVGLQARSRATGSDGAGPSCPAGPSA